MRKLVLSLITAMLLFPLALEAGNVKLEVYYFHATSRCESDLQIEQETKNIVESTFAKELQNGEITLRIVNFENEENKAVADKFEIGWSTLLINKIKDGKEEVVNLNDFAFTNIPSDPKNFRKGLEAKIRELME